MIKIIKVYKDSRILENGTLDTLGLAVRTDNEVDILRFKFDTLPDGVGTLLTTLKDINGDLIAFPLTRNDEENSFDLVMTQALVSQLSITFQLQIVQNNKVWNSLQATLKVHDCLEVGQGEMPASIDNWLINANIQLSAIESAEFQRNTNENSRITNERLRVTAEGEREAYITNLQHRVENGEFDGQDGATGPRGPKGDTGEQGYTPRKGIDYWTNADKSEIERDVVNQVSSIIPDVSNFITASVNNLVNYYLKSDTYNKTEIDTLLSTLKTGIFEVVSVLPTPSQDTLNVIYLVPSSNPQTQNIKDEYLTIPLDNGYVWENIGSTAIDLSGYATESWVNTQISNFLTETEIQQLINTAVNQKYTKPTLGIPKTDLASDVQTSLDKADNSLLVTEQVSGSTPTIIAENNHLYICGEVTTLDFTPSVTGICNVIFESGTTPTVLTLPNTVKMPEWFSIEANTTYEISILNGVYGAVMIWS